MTSWTEKRLLQKSISFAGFSLPTSSDDFFAISFKNFHPLILLLQSIPLLMELYGRLNLLVIVLVVFCSLLFSSPLCRGTINTSRCGEDVTAPWVGKGDVKIDVVSGVGVEEMMSGLLSVVVYLFLGSLRYGYAACESNLSV